MSVPRLLMRRAVHGTCLLLCTLSLVAGARPASALDPSRALTQYGHETWTSRQGLPQDTIQAITQTDDGYLWLATPAGLVRFDGMRFEVIGEGAVGPNQGNIWSMIRGREGGLWLGTEGGGLLRYRNGKFELFDRSEGLCNDFVRTLVEARDGSLWRARESVSPSSNE